MRDFYELTVNELTTWLVERGEKGYRAQQIFEWAYQHAATHFGMMSNLPKPLRDALATDFRIGPLPVLASTETPDTTKLLLELDDKRSVECVRIAMRKADTACVSSQVGCVVKCAFCATGQMGCERSLKASEIVAQVIGLAAAGARVGNIVFMGMGEPFHNYDAVVTSVRRFIDPHAFGLSPSRITVSTAGVVPMIRRYAKEGLATELAVSLNATTNTLRTKLMPGIAKWSIDELLGACAEFSRAHSGQPVTFAYVLLAGVNDDKSDAARLAALLHEQPHHVNVIPLNPVPGSQFTASSSYKAQAFVARLRELKVNASLRRSKGADVDAACGQLRNQQPGEQAAELPAPPAEPVERASRPAERPERPARRPAAGGRPGAARPSAGPKTPVKVKHAARRAAAGGRSADRPARSEEPAERTERPADRPARPDRQPRDRRPASTAPGPKKAPARGGDPKQGAKRAAPGRGATAQPEKPKWTPPTRSEPRPSRGNPAGSREEPSGKRAEGRPARQKPDGSKPEGGKPRGSK